VRKLMKTVIEILKDTSIEKIVGLTSLLKPNIAVSELKSYTYF